MNANGADGLLVQSAGIAQKRQQPAGLRPVLRADRQADPAAGAELARGLLVRTRGGGVGGAQVLRRGVALARQAQEGAGDQGRVMLGQQLLCERCLILLQREGPIGVVQQARLIRLQDGVGGGGFHPIGGDLGPFQDARGLAHGAGRHDQRADPLATRAPRPARAVQQAFGVGRQIRMDHQRQVWQVDPARRNIRGHADPCASIAHGLQGVGPLGLAQFARQADGVQPAIGQACCHVVDRRAGVGKDNGAGVVVKAQQVEDRVFRIRRVHPHRLIGDVGVLLAPSDRVDAFRVALVMLCQRGDHRRHGGGEQQRAPLLRGFAQHKLQIIAEAEVEHLIRLVQHHGAQPVQHQRLSLDMVAQAAGRAHNDMRAALQRAPFSADVHPAHAGGDLRAGAGIEPAKLRLHLQRQFPCWCDHQPQRQAGLTKACIVAKQGRGDGKAERNGFAGAGLGGDEQVAGDQVRVAHGLLHGGQIFIAARAQGIGEGRDHRRVSIGQGASSVAAGGLAQRARGRTRQPFKPPQLLARSAKVYGQSPGCADFAPQEHRLRPLGGDRDPVATDLMTS